MEAVQMVINWGWGILVQLFVPALVWAVMIVGLIRIVKDREKAERPTVWDEMDEEITEGLLYEPTACTLVCCQPGPTGTVIIEYVGKGS
jgi:hypothetical protein